MEETCLWEYQDLENYYHTSCGDDFMVSEGTPRENGMKYCTYCGKKIKERRAN